MGAFEQILLGIGALIIAFLFWPGAKAAMEESQKVENPDWQGVLIPIGLVVLFVVALVIIARS